MSREDDGEYALDDEGEHLTSEEELREREKEIWDVVTADGDDKQLPEKPAEEIDWKNPDLCQRLNDPKFHRTCQKLFAKFQAQLPQHLEGEDFEQDMIVRVATKFSQYRGDSDFNTWLNSTARNRLIDITRSQRGVRFECGEPENENDNGHESLALWDRCQTYRNMVAEDEDHRILFQELESKLSEKQRPVFVMYFREGRTTEEIAKKLGISRQAVSTNLGRIVKKLRAYIEQRSFRPRG